MKKYTDNKQAIHELLSLNNLTDKELMRNKRQIAKKHGLPIFSNAEILSELPIIQPQASNDLKRILRKRAVRTQSGIAPVAVLTKPYPCPGRCAYCPTEKNVPQSYLSNEPAVMRAIRCGYNPFVQVHDRLRALIANGHEPTKIELIVIGGTWSYLPVKYKYWYIVNCFRAANRFTNSNNHGIKTEKFSITDTQYPMPLSLEELKSQLLVEQKKNESARYRIIGLTLETRPDFINKNEIDEMRKLGCTRVELGVQHLDDGVLKQNRRGHGVEAIAKATLLLKNYGFKVTYHIMPGLPGSTPVKDFKMYRQLFSDERFQPDQIKFYPCVVTKGSLLYRWWRQGKYKPYSEKVLRNLIMRCKKATPEYVRIIRLIRDIPGESIVAGNRITNLRQIMKSEGVECRCIRCREIGNNDAKNNNFKIGIIVYQASGGMEYFIQAVTGDDKYLLGFCRLRIGNKTMSSSAIIRELHVYGELVPVGKEKRTQHAGLGKILMAEAEKIVREAGCEKIFVISGVGARGYYRKLGFRLEKTFMIRSLRH